jgi:hypothetical protein
VQNNKTYIRIFIWGVVGFILLIVGISVANIIWGKMYSATLELMIAPSDSTILVNDKPMEAGEHKMKPGEYKIEISREGFESEVKEVSLEEGGIEIVIIALTPNDPSTMDWYDTHEDDAMIADGVVSQEYAEDSDEMMEKYDILEDLPVYKYGYILGYGTCEDSGGPDFCVAIKAEFGYRDEAVKYLQNTGKDIAKYYVEMEDFSSPFSEVAINVPDGLEFDAEADSGLNTQVLETDSAAINATINERISKMTNIYDMAKVSEIKCFGGGKYCGVKVAVYDAEQYDETEAEGEVSPNNILHDTYRMVIAKVGDQWRVVSNLEFLLDYDSNPKLPREVVKLVDEL